MSSESHFDRSAGALSADDTLRMIAALPAPAGLEDRVKAGLRSAPNKATVIAWPFAPADGWMRSAGARAAAAAAIVLAIAGGGWGVYSHIQIAPVPAAFVQPELPNSAGRFSTAGAMHVPQTVEGPVIAAPVVEKHVQEPAKQQPVAKKKAKAHTSEPASADQSR
ncbi:hypothetical protein [Occallatibacter savannae]|uniref:hypothetical protein n=1 Tax=Occallatibacter savannae TaxID=1002691 RepID=UPI000D685527|nr:hypothetical protein [Occallatibacter savannae]